MGREKIGKIGWEDRMISGNREAGKRNTSMNQWGRLIVNIHDTSRER